MISLTPVTAFDLDESEDLRLAEVAEELTDADLEDERIRWAPHFARRAPSPGARSLLVDDFSAIPCLETILGLEFYSSRAFVRGGSEDVVAATFDPIPGYEAYQSDRLGLGFPSYVQVPRLTGLPAHAIFPSLLADEASLDRVGAILRESQEDFWIHPYMGHRGAWNLASNLQARSGRQVGVLSPLPGLTERVNNKVWFASAVRTVLGDEYALKASGAAGISELARRLGQMAASSNRVAVRLANSASGMGTDIFESEHLLKRSDQELESLAGEWIARYGWSDESPPLSVERWEEVVHSPSIQLWIPAMEEGLPVMEGIFDQLFEQGRPNVFAGSIPSRLSDCLQGKLAKAGVRLGRVLQRMGYRGRCSFDTIIPDQGASNSGFLFTECNGRWGGTSTPMSLMNRLFGDYRRQPYHCLDLAQARLKGVSFSEFVQELDDVLYDRSSGRGWAVVYNVGCLKPAGMLDVITLGDSYSQATLRQDEFQRRVQARF